VDVHHPRSIVAVVLVLAATVSACGSGVSHANTSTHTTTAPSTPVEKTLGNGVSATSIRLGVALVDFKAIEPYTDLIRTTAEQKQIYQVYIDNINAHGGINGRKIVPYFRFYTPLGTASVLSLCTSFADDDNVFAVLGTFIDFSGDAQTCIANQKHRVLMTFNLTQAIIDRSPLGLIVTPGDIPERQASILIHLLEKDHTLQGKTVAVLGDTTESSVVNATIVPDLEQAGVKPASTAILDVGTTGDTTAGQAQLDSFIEKWKTEHVNALFLSGDLAPTKSFVVRIKQAFPNMLLMADNGDVGDQAVQEQKANVKPNPYEGVLTAGGPSAQEYDHSSNWRYCASIYQAATGKAAPDAEHTITLPNGKIDDTYGTINDACQVVSMFHDIAERVGPYLNNTNWVDTVNHFGSIANRGSGPYSSLHTGKYAADDNWRLERWDSSLGTFGLSTPVTPLEDITGS
jgi:Periplasmic binding protein